jgi:hypothetical protein
MLSAFTRPVFATFTGAIFPAVARTEVALGPATFSPGTTATFAARRSVFPARTTVTFPTRTPAVAKAAFIAVFTMFALGLVATLAFSGSAAFASAAHLGVTLGHGGAA